MERREIHEGFRTSPSQSSWQRKRLWRLSRIDVPLTKIMTTNYYYRFHRSSRHSTAAIQEEGYHVKCPRALLANGLVRILTIA